MDEDVRLNAISNLPLKETIEKLESELQARDRQIESLVKELNKTKRLCEKANLYNEDLRKQVETLSAEFQNKRANRSVNLQVTSEEIDEAATNENWVIASEKANLSVADCVRATAEEVTRQAGFVYDQTSGYYYDSASGYYYDAEQALYYDANTGIYFFYNPETKAYEFHSQVDVSHFKQLQEVGKSHDDEALPKHSKVKRQSKSDAHEDDKVKPDKKNRHKKSKLLHDSDSLNDDLDGVGVQKVTGLVCAELDACSVKSLTDESSAEEGECSESSDGENEPKVDEESISVISDESPEDSVSQWPPCVRAIIQETNISKLTVGSLFLVTCSGALVGREKKCDICLPDIEVSKAHAELSYLDSENRYIIRDLGSQNGSFLNGVRLSEAKQVGENHAIKHDDVVEFGKTKLLLHVHKGAETCDNCEPGQVQAALAITNVSEKQVIKILSKEEKEQERKRALKQIKKKFGLEASAYEADSTVDSNVAYKDRAKQRRHVKGSDNPYEKTDVASVDKAISVENKGFKMMQKMGWSRGETLGKTQAGLKEPIPMEGQVSKAGFGMNVPTVPTATEHLKDVKKREKWAKARQRYEEVDQKLQQAEEDTSL